MSVWDDPRRVAKLHELWAAGVSTAQIAIALGLGPAGKNAVIGKKNRDNLPSRPSPIRNPQPRRPRQPVAPKLVELVPMQIHAENQIALPLAIPTERYGVGGRIQPMEQYADRRGPMIGVTIAGVVATPQPRTLPASAGGCAYIIGEPRGRHTVFCDAARQVGSSYCPLHHAVCWVSVEKKRHCEAA